MKSKTKIHKIGTKISLISFACIFTSVFLAIIIMLIGNSSLVNQIYTQDTNLAISALESRILDMRSSSLQCATDLAQYPPLIKAIQSGQNDVIFSAMNIAVEELGETTDFLTITDAKGNVLARMQADFTGYSALNQQNVKTALAGQSASFLETGDVVKLAVRSAAPVKDKDKNIIAVISTGFSLENPSLVNNLKALTGSQYSIFIGDELINSTLTSDQLKQMGNKLDASIAQTVLKEKRSISDEATLLDEPYFTYYEPILDSDGNAIGAFFAGKSLSSAKVFQRQVAITAILIVLIIAAISIFLFYRYSKKHIATPIRSMSALAEALSHGNLEFSISPVKSGDEMETLSSSRLSMRNTLLSYIKDISSHLTTMASGNMDVRITQEYVGNFSPIRVALQQIIKDFNQTLKKIEKSSGEVNNGARQLASGAQALAQGASQQASSIEELLRSLEHISKKVRENTEQMNHITQSVSTAVDNLGASSRQTQALMAAMNGIRDASGQIEKIIHTIDDIAFQTNLLALNASVEAARAGEYGKGFAVVATEVRNLAAKSAQASKGTAELIHNSLEKISEGVQMAEETAQYSRNAYQQLRQINQAIISADKISHEQSDEISRVTQEIERISAIVQTNSATAEESSAATDNLSGQAALLHEEVSRFHLKEVND